MLRPILKYSEWNSNPFPSRIKKFENLLQQIIGLSWFVFNHIYSVGFFFRFLSPDTNYQFLNLFLLLFELFMFAKLEVLINPVLKCWQEIMKIDISTIEPESTYNKFLQKWHDIINLYKSHHARGQYVWICLCVCFVECVCVCLCKQGCFIFDLYFILFLFW